MALTITSQTRNAMGGRWMTTSAITVDANYPAGGWPLSAAQLGMPTGQLDSVTAAFAGVTAVGAFNIQYDPVNQKLMLFGGAASAAPHAENATANIAADLTNLRVVAIGR